MTIVEFLTARLDEDEAAALAAPGREWAAYEEDSVAGASVYDEQWVLLYPQHYDHDNPLSADPGATGPMYIERARDQLCAHIARQDPARVLADIAAKRAIIERYLDSDKWSEQGHYDEYAAEAVGLQTALTLLASVYSTHPDFNPEWA